MHGNYLLGFIFMKRVNMTPEDEEFEAIAKRQAKKQAEKSLGDGDCDSPSWCKHYGKCHRKSVRAPMLANCIDTAETQKPVP